MDNAMFQAAYQARHRHELELRAERDAAAKRRLAVSAAPGRTAGQRGLDGKAELAREQFHELSEAAKRAFLERVRKGEAKLLDPARR